jgi:hypothetical protein
VVYDSPDETMQRRSFLKLAGTILGVGSAVTQIGSASVVDNGFGAGRYGTRQYGQLTTESTR